MWGSTVNPNPPRCQDSHLRGSGRPSGRNLLLQGDAQPWGRCHRDPPSPKAPAAALLPPSEGSPGSAALHEPHVLEQRTSRGAFLHSIIPRPPPRSLQPYGDTLLTFWDRVHQLDINLAHFGTTRPQFFHHILHQARQVKEKVRFRETPKGVSPLQTCYWAEKSRETHPKSSSPRRLQECCYH